MNAHEYPRKETRMNTLYRNRDDKMITGVCSGLADYFEVDVSLIRLFFFATSIISVFIYFILSITTTYRPPGGYIINKNKYSLYKINNKHKILGGVLLGLSDYYKTPPYITRIIFILILFLSHKFSWFIILYIAAYFILPEKSNRKN